LRIQGLKQWKEKLHKITKPPVVKVAFQGREPIVGAEAEAAVAQEG
jgi:hypothetical protein